MAYIIIKVTYPNKEEADKIIKHLLTKRLISSANTFPIRSTSSWTGKIMEVDEYIALFKTRRDNWEIVKTEIKKLHSYKIPCITKIEAEANKDYEDWVVNQTK